MKRKKHLILIFLFSFSIVMNFTAVNVEAQVGTYELRTNPSNPFLFTVDTIYTTISGSITLTGDNYFYHQVNLEENKHYLFYLVGGYIGMDATAIWFHSAVSAIVDEYYKYFSESQMDLLLYYNPSTTGLHNLTIWTNVESGGIGLYGIGVLEIPVIPLDTKITHDYWDFISDPIMAGIIELESGKEYQTGYNGTHADYLGSGDMYYSHVNQLYSIPYTVGIELTGSHDLMNYSAYDIITTQNLGQGSGKYLFYSLGFGYFSLMEKIETTTIHQFIPGYPLLVLGLISLVSVFIISKKVLK